MRPKATLTRSEKLDLRLTPDAKRTLQTAAAALSRSVSDFVLDSALERAAETLPDRTNFQLDSERWREFQGLLDAEPRSNPRLVELLRRPGFFDPSA
ncbi:MAG: DUF1778 domain-containing protein [Vicinamibacterales bacterium]